MIRLRDNLCYKFLSYLLSRNVIHATALLKKIGQEAGKRRSSLQIEDASLNEGLPLINENSTYEASKNINIMFGSGKYRCRGSL